MKQYNAIDMDNYKELEKMIEEVKKAQRDDRFSSSKLLLVHTLFELENCQNVLKYIQWEAFQKMRNARATLDNPM